MMSLWDALRMNMMISYQELVRTFPKLHVLFSPSAQGDSPREKNNTVPRLFRRYFV
ncbi:Uncharacterised protein [Enterobacter hormaechei]|nr:Uncharacterised protein [Enterobacter hormaechei]